jgi:hypothetical protein
VTDTKPAEAPASAPSGPVTLHLLSDSTGNLARHMLAAFLTQFPDGAFRLHPWTFLDATPKLHAALSEIHDGIVLHAVVLPESKRTVERHCAERKLPCCDLTGQFVSFLATASGLTPRPDVERLHLVSDEYIHRIRALEFTLEHDDALGLDTLHKADLVLAGVSRTSKTPTSIYLGQQGYKVANVALAPQVAPPKELLSMPSSKVVGLLIDPHRLAELRRTRQHAWHMSADESYHDYQAVEREVTWSRRLFAQQGWQTLDVTDSAVEETAARILELTGLHRQTHL